jgi:hypothetical protein
MLQTSSTSSIVETAAALRRQHPEMQAIEVLDRVLGRPGLPRIDASLMNPGSHLGGLIAEAFDPVMTPSEWAAWAGEGSDVLIHDALLKVWREEILPRVDARYRGQVH